MPNDKANFPPITMLPVLLAAVADALEASQEQLSNFRRAGKKPYALDDKTVNAVINAFTQQNKHILNQKSLCTHWRKSNLNTTKLNMLTQLEEKLAEMEVINKQVIALATACKNVTIEKLMDKKNGELALEYLKEKLLASSKNKNPVDFNEDFYGEENDEYESDVTECPVCGEPVAMVIFAPEANDSDDLECCADVMFDTIQEMDVPTWIMGEERIIPMDDQEIGAALVMQAHPIQEAAQRLPTILLDAQLEALAASHCEDDSDYDDEEDEEVDDRENNDTDNTSHHPTEKLAKLNKTITNALFELRALTELDTSSPQELFGFVKTFLMGIISTSVDLVEMQQPGIATALYAEVEAIGKMGGLRSIAEFQDKFSDRTYSVSQIADDDMEAAMNYIGQELGTTLIKSMNELPLSLRQPETALRSIEALLGNMLNQKFTNPHDILDSLCEHVHLALDSLERRKH